MQAAPAEARASGEGKDGFGEVLMSHHEPVRHFLRPLGFVVGSVRQPLPSLAEGFIILLLCAGRGSSFASCIDGFSHLLFGQPILIVNVLIF